jgi:hypothetical protein
LEEAVDAYFTDEKFYYDEDTFNLLFPEREDAVVRLAGWADTPGNVARQLAFIEMHYLCVDAFSIPALLEQF